MLENETFQKFAPETFAKTTNLNDAKELAHKNTNAIVTLESNVDDFAKFRSEVAADLDTKIDNKLVEFLATDVRTAFGNSMRAPAAHAGERVQIIERMLGVREDGEDKLKIKEANETNEPRAEKT